MPGPVGFPETCIGASSLSSCLHLWQAVWWMGSPSFWCSLPAILRPEKSGLPWRHPPFGLAACCLLPRSLYLGSSLSSSSSPSPFWLLRLLPLPSELFPSPLFLPLPLSCPSPLFSLSPPFSLSPLFSPSPLEEGLSSQFLPPCLPGGGCPRSSGSLWGDGSVSPSDGVLRPGVGGGVALPGGVGGVGGVWGSSGGVG